MAAPSQYERTTSKRCRFDTDVDSTPMSIISCSTCRFRLESGPKTDMLATFDVESTSLRCHHIFPSHWAPIEGELCHQVHEEWLPAAAGQAHVSSCIDSRRLSSSLIESRARRVSEKGYRLGEGHGLSGALWVWMWTGETASRIGRRGGGLSFM